MISLCCLNKTSHNAIRRNKSPHLIGRTNKTNKIRQSHNKSARLAAEVSNGDNDNSHNQTVQGKSLSENQHQNHTDEDLLLLTTSANTSVSSNTNGQTGSQARQTAAETSSQMTKSVEARVVGSLGGRSLNYSIIKAKRESY